LVGAHKADSNSNKLDSGKSYVIFGKIDSTAIDLSAIASGNGTGGFVINGENANDISGSDLPLTSARKAPIIKSSKPSPLTSPALEIEVLL
jgi:hypothetical protein